MDRSGVVRRPKKLFSRLARPGDLFSIISFVGYLPFVHRALLH
jgi:hypothetical protein